jgi:hypothetical protein
MANAESFLHEITGIKTQGYSSITVIKKHRGILQSQLSKKRDADQRIQAQIKTPYLQCIP